MWNYRVTFNFATVIGLAISYEKGWGVGIVLPFLGIFISTQRNSNGLDFFGKDLFIKR